MNRHIAEGKLNWKQSITGEHAQSCVSMSVPSYQHSEQDTGKFIHSLTGGQSPAGLFPQTEEGRVLQGHSHRQRKAEPCRAIPTDRGRQSPAGLFPLTEWDGALCRAVTEGLQTGTYFLWHGAGCWGRKRKWVRKPCLKICNWVCH